VSPAEGRGPAFAAAGAGEARVIVAANDEPLVTPAPRRDQPTARRPPVSTDPQELRKEIEDLKASQAARMATMGAAQAGTVRATVAGGVSFVVGMLMGIIIARAGRRRLL
jgi:hypothetical protein